MVRVYTFRSLQGVLRNGVPLIWLLLFGTILILSACKMVTGGLHPDVQQMRGAATKEQVVQRYLQSLEQMDADAIVQLTPPDHIANQEVQRKLASFGGHKLQNIRVQYKAPVGPLWVRVIIQGAFRNEQGKEVVFNDELNLQQITDRWYLMLGRSKNAVPLPLPSN